MTSRSSRGPDTPALRGKLGRARSKHGKAQAVQKPEKRRARKLTQKVRFAMPPRINVRPTAYHFEWDQAKNRSNIRKHGFDFADAEEMFRGVLLAHPDTREDYGENRWIGIGAIRGRTAVVVFAERGPATIRIISLRKADREERKQYEKAIQDGLEAN